MTEDQNKELTAQQIKDSKALLGCEPPEKLQYDLSKEERDSIKIDYRNANYSSCINNIAINISLNRFNSKS